eukprot:7382728-Prymnesium_polylepis.2
MVARGAEAHVVVSLLGEALLDALIRVVLVALIDESPRRAERREWERARALIPFQFGCLIHPAVVCGGRQHFIRFAVLGPVRAPTSSTGHDHHDWV